MSSPVVFPSKFEDATVEVSFDFSSSLAIGETLSSAVVSASVFSGEDAAPEDLISGTATLDGTVVAQIVTGGVVGVVYVLNCAATTSEGQDIIMQGKLAVISTDPF